MRRSRRINSEVLFAIGGCLENGKPRLGGITLTRTISMNMVVLFTERSAGRGPTGERGCWRQVDMILLNLAERSDALQC